jgi:hypothetical protein
VAAKARGYQRRGDPDPSRALKNATRERVTQKVSGRSVTAVREYQKYSREVARMMPARRAVRSSKSLRATSQVRSTPPIPNRAQVRRAASSPRGATTRSGLLSSPLRARFGVTFRLDYYDAPELGTIVRRSARILDVEIAEDAADEIARRSRGTPRIANRILRRVRDVAQVKHDGVITNEVAREALELLEVDDRGLERIDRELLSTILLKFGGGPVGLSTLAVALGEEQDTIEDVYEPFLLQLGFLQRTPRGRIITELGREQLGAPPAADGTKLF